jgi:Trk K+ transport system NAD-binding subunit
MRRSAFWRRPPPRRPNRFAGPAVKSGGDGEWDAMSPLPLIVITGDDTLAERVCAELGAPGDVEIRVLSMMNADRREAIERTGATVIAKPPDSDDALDAAGVATAFSILTLSNDDEANLAVALRARMLNPSIRVVLRQFGTKIGRKIEQNLANCAVISPAAHAATTYAGAALDAGCFFALRFPPGDDGEFVGFTEGVAKDLGIARMSVGEAEAYLDARVVAIGDAGTPPGDAPIDDNVRVTIFGRIVERRAHTTGGRRTDRGSGSLRRRLAGLTTLLVTLNPILRTIVIGAVVFYASTLLFFHFTLHSTWDGAAFDVAQMMTNSGFGDASVTQRGLAITLAVIAAMIGGTIFTSIFIGYVSSAITRAQWTALQGLRQIHGRGHVVICGAGRIGGAVVELLQAAGKHIVVVDPMPDPNLMRLARDGVIDLLTGDARHEDVLALCDVPHASALVVLTNSDPGNLEVALGARALRPDVPLVMRMEGRTFAQATARLFDISTFSPAALSAPAFAGLARFAGTVGRVRFAGAEHTIVRRGPGHGSEPIPPNAIPLCVWHERRVTMLRGVDSATPGDTVLLAIPSDSPFDDGYTRGSVPAETKDGVWVASAGP